MHYATTYVIEQATTDNILQEVINEHLGTEAMSKEEEEGQVQP
jgi:hypothetical protein